MLTTTFQTMWDEKILHVDMDSFFVEVERLRDPGLRGVPVAVGGAGPRGVIASASYEARARGVKSAQPSSVALRMCPDLTIVAPSHGRYGEVSAEVFDIFRSVTPLVEGLSLDEAFLDIGGLRRHYESPVQVAEILRSEISSKVGLPASVGIAPVKFVAKLASEDAKPDGVFMVSAEDVLTYLNRLPASRMWGVGPATMASLQRLGVETIGDIASLKVEVLVSALGPSQGRHLSSLANGLDDRQVVPDARAKSISIEQTFESSLASRQAVVTALWSHSHDLHHRLRRAGLRARTISLKIRYDDFTTVTRSHTLDRATDGQGMIADIGTELLASAESGDPVRLLGLSGTGLESASEPIQSSLGDDDVKDRLEDAVAAVNERFGGRRVRPARLDLEAGHRGQEL